MKLELLYFDGCPDSKVAAGSPTTGQLEAVLGAAPGPAGSMVDRDGRS